jgi:hypothetical protein
MEKFVDFARCKADAGEPSSHVRCVVAMGEHESWGQRVWMIGCYAAPYSIPSGEVIWRQWPYERIVEQGTDAFSAWILATWGHLVIRNERRCVRSPIHFVQCLVGYFAWIATLDAMVERGSATYRALWNSVSDVPYVGRYIAIRILEARPSDSLRDGSRRTSAFGKNEAFAPSEASTGSCRIGSK